MKTFFRQRPPFRYLALIGILALLLVFCYILYNSYKADIHNHKQSRIEKLNISYNAIINLHQHTSLLLYETVINTPETWEILANANSSDSLTVDQARRDLYLHLKGHYALLTDFNIRQFHFHLPNNHSLLRFHRPNKYGDDLSSTRYSIVETNRLLKPHFGFEEGRIYNGFRYVFPIINAENKHLGSVEVSLNFDAIQKELNQLHPKTYAFYIHKDLVEKKVFASEQNNYIPTTLHDKLLSESCFEMTPAIATLNRNISKRSRKKIDNFESFCSTCYYQKAFRIITFLPIHNVEQHKSAYIVSYEEDESIKYTYIKYISIITFSLILLLFIAGLLIQLRTNNIKLEKSQGQLITSNTAKDKFFSIIAHDIKGPVSSSAELIRFLKDNYQNMGEEKIKHTLDVVFSSLNDTYKLLLNLLHWSRTQRGTMEFKPVKTHLMTITKESIAPLTQLANNKEINITTKLSKDIWVNADHTMLSIIIRNIVSNAIKFTPHHGSIYIFTPEQNPTSITICIKDTGQGIAEKNQAQLLNIDKESSTKGTDNESGTGLGLVLCKEFINYHKGDFWFESEENKGTSFYFSLPLA